MKLTSILITTLLSLFCISCAPKCKVVNMCTEWIENPICIDTQTPRFTWNYEGNIIPQTCTYTLFDESGVVLSKELEDPKQMSFIPDSPLNLKSMTRYSWTIAVKNTNGRVYQSKQAYFETAIISQEDWHATWISDGKDKDTQASPILVKNINISKEVDRARLYYSAVAYADITINSNKISSSSLNPAYTHYDKRNLYISKDVTSLLVKGENQIVAILGNGFYNVIDYVAVWDFDKAAWRNRPSMIAQLYVKYKDGTEAIIGTDTSWRVMSDMSYNPYLENNVYSGDKLDYSRTLATALSNKDIWAPAIHVPAPSPKLESQYMAENSVDIEYEAMDVKSFGDTVFVCDFSYNMSGVTTFEVSGQKGTKVRVQHGEMLFPDGRLDITHMDEHFRPKEGHEFQTDVFYLAEGDNTLRGDFSYDGFRYAEIKSDRPIKVKRAKASFIHTGMKSTASLNSSEKLIEDIHTIIKRSYLSNFMGIPTDCPQREKNGWTADAHVSAELGMFNYNPVNAYLKWLDDIIDNQLEDGQITAIIPSHGWGMNFGPVWDAVLFVIPEVIYDYSGDLRAIEKIAPACRKYLSWLQTREAEDGGIEFGLGDWVHYKTSTPHQYTSTCYYYYMLNTMARFERVLGNDDAYYVKKAQDAKDLINSKYFNSKDGIYANGSQTALSLALYLNIVPSEYESKVAENLSKNVSNCDNHLDCGVIGSKTVLRALTKYGYADQAYKMVVQEDGPSWANWIKMGYTTPPEQWVATKDMNLSYNHVFLGDVDAWFYSDLAGINYDPTSPGFAHIIFKPHFVEGLDSISAEYQSVRGLISSKWKKTRSGVKLDLTVPSNTTATLYVGDKKFYLSAGQHSFNF